MLNREVINVGLAKLLREAKKIEDVLEKYRYLRFIDDSEDAIEHSLQIYPIGVAFLKFPPQQKDVDTTIFHFYYRSSGMGSDGQSKYTETHKVTLSELIQFQDNQAELWQKCSPKFRCFSREGSSKENFVEEIVSRINLEGVKKFNDGRQLFIDNLIKYGMDTICKIGKALFEKIHQKCLLEGKKATDFYEDYGFNDKLISKMQTDKILEVVCHQSTNEFDLILQWIVDKNNQLEASYPVTFGDMMDFLYIAQINMPGLFEEIKVQVLQSNMPNIAALRITDSDPRYANPNANTQSNISNDNKKNVMQMR